MSRRPYGDNGMSLGRSRIGHRCEGASFCRGVAARYPCLNAWLCGKCHAHISKRIKDFNAEFLAQRLNSATDDRPKWVAP